MEKIEEEHDEEVMTLCGRRKRKIGEIKRRKKMEEHDGLVVAPRGRKRRG